LIREGIICWGRTHWQTERQEAKGSARIGALESLDDIVMMYEVNRHSNVVQELNPVESLFPWHQTLPDICQSLFEKSAFPLVQLHISSHEVREMRKGARQKLKHSVRTCYSIFANEPVQIRLSSVSRPCFFDGRRIDSIPEFLKSRTLEVPFWHFAHYVEKNSFRNFTSYASTLRKANSFVFNRLTGASGNL
jgi:hypothetical protein